jgi:predicted ribosome quality control (RQC) complex YloA/Tae2 family protein
VPVGEVADAFADPILALNKFILQFLHLHGLNIARDAAKAKVKQRIKQTEKYLSKIGERLLVLKTERNPEEVGHLLMSNAHLIDPNQNNITVQDWYRLDANDQPTLFTIALKPTVSVPKQAEALYRKAGNRKLEQTHLGQQVVAKESLMLNLMQWLDELDLIESRKELKQWLINHQLEQPERQTGDSEDALPYKKFEADGFEIRVGKNAVANDELTLHYAYKEDLWLHARGYAGSHVIIKYQAGKSIPKSTIEYAAGLAVWYSKGKAQPLCPVIMTPKKFVRKPKGSAPGSVIVERETVLMASAIKPKQETI